jgi:hypothetical protein
MSKYLLQVKYSPQGVKGIGANSDLPHICRETSVDGCFGW